jgi:hypothetical protein
MPIVVLGRNWAFITDVLEGVKFKDGVNVIEDEATTTDEKVAA